MKQKLITLFIFTFFLSSTGLPISLHYCQMQGSASLSSCEMCNAEESEKENSCCEADDDNTVQLKSDESNQCCVTQIIESSVKDHFLLAVNDVKIEIKNLSLSFTNNFEIPSLQIEINHHRFSDSSPPSTNNHIYILNSVLLI